MKRKFIPLRCFLVAVFLLVIQANALASEEPVFVNPLKGSMNQLIKGSTSYINLAEEIDTSTIVKPVNRITNIISFYVNEDTTMFLSSNFIAKVKFHLYYKNAAGTLDSLKDQWLEIDYRGAVGDSVYNRRKSFYFYNAHYTQIVVDSFYTNVAWNVKPALILMNEMRLNADYKFECTLNAIENINLNSDSSQLDELYVSWTKPQGSDEYDLEWAYIDSSALDIYKTGGVYDPLLIFENNATRVTLVGLTNYRIPLLYDGGGILFYRVRPVQNKLNGKRIEGSWATSSSAAGTNWYYSYQGHQLPLNWQASTSFAEEGKRKSVVQYFDGTLRSRQTVTKDNTTRKTVVAESLYDHQGRPVIQVLPAPTLSNIIAYTQNFNRMNTGEYDKSRYDSLTNPSAYCNTAADTMSVLSGASYYYSSKNTAKDTLFNRFIPDAKGYPFTETQYTQDNTGRISKQSGVGPDHKMGSGHETKYYYGTASQREIDGLFGTEVGNYTHYFKNMVRDANGQYSVSYVDMKGRTIATALAGKLNDSIKLDTLSSHYIASITEKLVDSSSNTIKGLTMEASKGLIVTKQGTHRFQYSLLPDSIRIENCDEINICYDCYYDLEVTISGDCYNQQFGGNVFKILKTNLTLGVPDTSCGFLQAPFVIDTSIVLAEGSYLITKKLTISRFATDYYRDSIFLLQNLCKTKEDFIQEQIDSMRLQSVCEITCTTCTASLGTWDSYRHNYMLESGYLFSDTASHRAEAWTDYQQAIRLCNEICEKKGLEFDIRNSMLADVTPLSGQYADTLNIDGYSIFRKQFFGIGPQIYTRARYTDENGKPDSAFNKLGEWVPVHKLEMDLFVPNFKPEWADSLLQYHPEYCFLKNYEALKVSHQWDNKFLQIETFAEANAWGFINPSGVEETNFQYSSPLTIDPLFSGVVTLPEGESYESLKIIFNQKLRVFSGYVFDYHTIWEHASFMGKCPPGDKPCAETMMNVANAFDTNIMCAGELDMAWRTFRELYYREKQRVIYEFLDQICPGVSIPSQYAVRFPDPKDGVAPFTYAMLDDSTAAKLAVKNGLYKGYVDNCTANAEQWLLQLSQCYLYDTANLRAEVLPHLINICVKGSDIWHPFGSSSISPDSSYTFTSFQQVIDWYNTNHSISDELRCNAYVITNPPAYGKQSSFANKPIWNKPDSCDCDRITSLHSAYSNNPSGYSSFSDYMFRKQGTSISNSSLDSLLNLCNGIITCNFLTAPLILPPSMQCGVKDVCVDCYAVDSAYQQFQTNHPGITPVYEDGQDSIQQMKNKLFAGFMNSRLGFSYPHTVYLQFLDSCASRGEEMTACDTLSKIVTDFRNSYYVRDSVSLDSSGCNVANWRLNWVGVYGGQYAHDMKYKMPDYRQNGIFKKLLRDSSQFTLPLNYFPTKPICAKNGFAIEMKIRFPLDSIDKAIYERAVLRTGDPFWLPYYGRIVFTTSFYSPGDTAIAPVFIMKENLTSPAPASYVAVAASPTFYPYTKNPDPEMVLPAGGAWGTYKWKFKNDSIWLYLDGVLLSVSTTNGVRFDRFLSFRINTHGLNFEMDHLKLYGANDSLEYVDDFTTPCFPPEPVRPKACPSVSCDTAFKDYYNTARGTSLSYAQIIAHYQATCGAPPVICNAGVTDTTNITSADLHRVKKEFYYTYVQPGTGTVDYDLRTFAGNKTPDEGPKGVFNVNNNLIGNTVNGTVSQIKNSYASIWNSDSSNNAFGTLTVLENGKFRLTLNSGQSAPCNGIIGMRYYQVDFASDTLNSIGTGDGSYVDFGDGVRTALPFKKDSLLTGNTKISHTGNEYYIHYKYMPDVKQMRTVWVQHIYPDSALRTITLYHSDNNGYVGFDLWHYPAAVPYPAFKLRYLRNLRGYFPQDIGRMDFNSVRDSTLLDFSNIYNFNQIASIQRIGFGNSQFQQPVTALDYNNVQPMTANKQLRRIAFTHGDYSAVPTKPAAFHKMFPNLPVNFPNLAEISIGGTMTTAEVNTDSINFSLPRLANFALRSNTISSAQIDLVINQIGNTTQVDSGRLNIYSWTGALRTSASQAAIDRLISKKWTIILGGTYVSDVPYTATITTSKRLDSIPNSNEFTDYFNQSFGTKLSYHQIEQLYLQKYGEPLNYCSPPVNSAVLCGKSEAIYVPIDTIAGVCADSTELGIVKGTILYEAYKDSIKNSFEDAYLAKCLQAFKYESFTVTRPVSEFHYTLYYYDQAGNLVKTVPPAGVNPIYRQTWLDSVAAYRIAKTHLAPPHTLTTIYRYNTLNQVIAQHTPDAKKSQFWYDRLGRLVVSQNFKQFHESTKNYSYTLYDALGRITEVGQKPQSTAMTNSISRSQNSLGSWINAAGFVKQQITKTVYDLPVVDIGVNDRLVQRNLRNRVSYTEYWDLGSNPEWNSAVFYSYDVHGNVDTLLNDYGSSLHTATQNPMNLTGNRWKKIVYRYDLISGKVNHVAYQPNVRDALYHRYEYDAENRLVQAEISKDSLYWERDAKYSYYRHGPLARTVIGEQKVQGLDYAYTLQGWLKAVNGTVMNPLYDMGKDGHNSNNVARDTFGFMLYYHDNDYTAIGEASRFKGLRARLIGTSSHRPLFNGNISAMAVNIGVLNKPVLYDYTYDQLNRLTAMDMFNGTNAAANLWDVPAGTFLPVVHYRERIAYDANGNITKYRRNASNGQHLMDSLSYYYKPGTNQLTYVRDSIPGYFYSDYYAEATGRRGHDIDNQFVNNYAYDSIGNLVRDSAEAIRLTVGGIKWNVYGKITEINKVDSGLNAFNAGRFKKINYYYDASGNRIGARYERYGGKPTYSTWYVRDASGNVMGVYSYTDSMRLSELHLYGSSRLGVLQPGINMQANIPTGQAMPQLDQTINQVTFTRGNKFFELSNHLGNVLVTLSDKKRGVQNGSTGTVLHYLSIVKSAQDYYPFGMVMPLRQFTSGSSYRYGFNGKEEDDEVKGNGNQQDYGMRIYDPRLGRFLSVDPLTRKYSMLTPFQYASNSPIANIDLDGLEAVEFWIPIYWTMFKAKLESTIKEGYKATGRLASGQSGEISTPKEVRESADPITRSVVKAQGVGEDLVKALDLFSISYKAANFGASVAVPEAGAVMSLFDIYKGDYISGAIGVFSFGYGGRLQAMGGVLPQITTSIPKLPKFSIGSKFKLGFKFSADLPPGTALNGGSFNRVNSKIPLGDPLAITQIANGCEDVARTVQKSIGGEFLQITPSQGRFLGPVNYSKGTVNGWTHHVAVVKDGMVFDGMTGAAGMPLGQYKSMFEYSDALKFEQVKNITVK